MGVVGRKRPPLSCISSEGGEEGGWKETAPSILHFKRGRGGGWLEGNGLLCLAFQAREGRGVGIVAGYPGVLGVSDLIELFPRIF